MKVVISGSRGWHDRDAIRRRLADLPDDVVIIHGGARGADMLADEEAAARGFLRVECHPNWIKDGKRAGILRNLAMLDMKPELVLAFWDGESRGTAHTIGEAKRRGIPVEVIAA